MSPFNPDLITDDCGNHQHFLVLSNFSADPPESTRTLEAFWSFGAKSRYRRRSNSLSGGQRLVCALGSNAETSRKLFNWMPHRGRPGHKMHCKHSWNSLCETLEGQPSSSTLFRRNNTFVEVLPPLHLENEDTHGYTMIPVWWAIKHVRTGMTRQEAVEGHVNMSLLHLAEKNESKYIKMIAAVKRTCTVVSKREVVDVQGNMS